MFFPSFYRIVFRVDELPQLCLTLGGVELIFNQFLQNGYKVLTASPGLTLCSTRLVNTRAYPITPELSVFTTYSLNKGGEFVVFSISILDLSFYLLLFTALWY